MTGGILIAASNAYGPEPCRADEVFFLSTRGAGDRVDPATDLHTELLVRWLGEQRAAGCCPLVRARAPFEGPGLAAFLQGLRFGLTPLEEGLDRYAAELHDRAGVAALMLPSSVLLRLDRELRLNGPRAASEATTEVPGARVEPTRQVVWQRPVQGDRGGFLHFAPVYPMSSREQAIWTVTSRIPAPDRGPRLRLRHDSAASWAAALRRDRGVQVAPVLPQWVGADEAAVADAVADAGGGRRFVMRGPRGAPELIEASSGARCRWAPSV